jgi:hypothetical protein
MITIEVDYRESFFKKTNSQTYKTALNTAIKRTTLEAESQCKKESPVRTGRLMGGHASTFGELEGCVTNGVEYAQFVIEGTKNQAANNYPGRVVANLKSTDYLGKSFKTALRQSGVYD